MLIWPALALTFIQSPPEPIEFASTDGHCIARIEHDHLTVFAVEAADKRRELWNAPFRSNIKAAKYALANSGDVIAQVAQDFNESHTMLCVQFRGQDAVLWNGSDLHIPRQVLGGSNLERTWIDEARAPIIAWSDTWFGPRLQLQIPVRGGLTCAIDVEHNALIENAIAPPPVQAEPAVQGELPERCAVPYVQSATAATVVRAGSALEVSVSATHATPGWTLLGFKLVATGADGRALVLTPRSVAPEGIAPQVLSPFRTNARLINLRPGHYTLDVDGWSEQHIPLTIDVVPESLLVSLHTRGGFAGIDQWVAILSPSAARIDQGRGVAARYVELSAQSMEKLRAAIAALPATNRRAQTAGSADLFEHTLSFWSGEHWITIDVDDLAATQAEREMIQELRSL